MIEDFKVMSGMDIGGRNKLLFYANADSIIRSINSGKSKRRIHAELRANNAFMGSYSWFLRMCKQLLPLYRQHCAGELLAMREPAFHESTKEGRC